MSAIEITEKILRTKIITKEVASQQLLLRELVGGTLFDLAQQGRMVIGVENGKLIINKIKGETLSDIWDDLSSVQKNMCLTKIAFLLTKVREAYKLNGATLLSEVSDFLSFSNFMERNLIFISKLTSLSPPNKRLLIRQLLELKLDAFDLTLIHGDLNLANIIQSEDQLMLIDFEHVVEAPIELELAPAAFWKDQVALPLAPFRKALQSVGLSLSSEHLKQSLALYFVNQLRLAKQSNDQKKIKQLTSIAIKRQIIK